MSVAAYHLSELEIARTPGDPRRTLPVLPTHFGSIVDIGCGAGQTLIACELPADVFACGLDLDNEALALGRSLSEQIHFVLGSAEKIPFDDGSFEVAVSRVTLPIVHIPAALQEIARVLRPGGHLWITLHPFAKTRSRLRASLRAGRLRDVLYTIYIISNGLLFHYTGKLFRFPLNRRRCESFQTTASITRALLASGFRRVQTETKGEVFMVTAVRI